jgi:hypothetical protein
LGYGSVVLCPSKSGKIKHPPVHGPANADCLIQLLLVLLVLQTKNSLMKSLKKLNKIAIIICFLFYLTCYLRFIGQGFLCLVQIVTAVVLTPKIYATQIDEFKKRIKTYWLVTAGNLIILGLFFEVIMWNDFLQFPFVSIFPNIMAIYFYRLLTEFIDYEDA